MTDWNTYRRNKIQERYSASKTGLDTIKELVDGNNLDEDALSCASISLKRVCDELIFLTRFLTRVIDAANADKKGLRE